MASLFISYSRRNIEIASHLTNALDGKELDYWIDWEGIPPTVPFWREIQKGIEEADNFIFLLSPDSVQSKVCRQEIEHAVKNGKRLIPVVIVDTRTDEVPPELRSLNWVFLRESDNFESSFDTLVTAIKTDYEWVQVHRRLQVKALEWERSGHENGFLLRGKDLQDAEAQLAKYLAKEPRATELQHTYVLRSRQTSDKQRRITTTISIAGIISLAVLAILALVQAGIARNAEATAVSNASIAETERANAILESNGRATAQANAEANQILAEERARIALGGELAAQSLVNDQPLLSLLLSAESLRYLDGRAQRNSLLSSLQAVPGLNTILHGLPASVWSVAFSRDGSTLAAGTADGTITLWDVVDPENPRRLGVPLDSHTNVVWSVAFSPDGNTLAAGTADQTIILWDTSNLTAPQQLNSPLVGHSDDVKSVVFSPDGKTLASAGCAEKIDDRCIRGEILLWDVSDPRSVAIIGKPLDAHAEIVQTLAFRPDSELLVSGGWDNTILIWDVSDPTAPIPVGEPLTGHTLPILSVAFSPDGKTLASGSMDNTIRLWDLSEPESPLLLGKPIADHTEDVWSVAFSPDGKILASGSTDHTIILRDVSDPRTPTQLGSPLVGHTNIVLSVAFRPDGKTLASGGVDRTVILWNVSDLLVSPIQWNGPLLHSGYVWDVAFSPDGSTLASGAADGAITLWDSSNPGFPRQIGGPLSGPTRGAESVAFSPDGSTLASSGCGKNQGEICTEGEIILWNVSHPGVSRMLGNFSGGHTDDVPSVAFSPDGKILASGSWDRTITLWDISNPARAVQIGEPLRGHEGMIFSIAFRPDGRILASAGEDFSIMLWDMSNLPEPGQPSILPIKHTNFIWSIAFSPDGKILASGSFDNTLILWDVSNSADPFQLGEPLSHGDDVTSVAFSPDGKMLASGTCGKRDEYQTCIQGEITLWDVSTPTSPLQLGRPLTGHTNTVTSLAFSPDSKTLASSSLDNTVLLWDVDPSSWADRACAKAGRNFSRLEWSQYVPNEGYIETCAQWPPEQITQ